MSIMSKVKREHASARPAAARNTAKDVAVLSREVERHRQACRNCIDRLDLDHAKVELDLALRMREKLLDATERHNAYVRSETVTVTTKPALPVSRSKTKVKRYKTWSDK